MLYTPVFVLASRPTLHANTGINLSAKPLILNKLCIILIRSK